MDDRERIERLENRLDRLEARLFDLGSKMTALAMMLSEQAVDRRPTQSAPTREAVEKHREMQRLSMEIGDMFGSARGKIADIKRRMKTPNEGVPIKTPPTGARKRGAP